MSVIFRCLIAPEGGLSASRHEALRERSFIHDLFLPRRWCGVFRPVRRFRRGLRAAAKERVVTELYIAAGIVVGLLMAYLLVALVKPEMFP